MAKKTREKKPAARRDTLLLIAEAITHVALSLPECPECTALALSLPPSVQCSKCSLEDVRALYTSHGKPGRREELLAAMQKRLPRGHKLITEARR